jgi:ABC-type Zn2+ transport system substrate-binding protein/surface adhesin
LFGCLLRPAFRKLTMVAVAVALAVAPLPAALVHAAPDSAGQLSLAEQEAAEHGHSHDEADGADHSAHHKHGHDPADHSHQYAFLAGASSQWGLPPAQRWPCALNGRPDAAIGLGIERPPKRIMSL